MNKELKRWLIYIVANQLLAIGIILNTRTNMGVAAFTSSFYAMSRIFSLSLGTCSMILYLVLIVIQVILLRKITLQIILEIPFSLLFSLLTDFYNWLIPTTTLSLFSAGLLLLVAIYLISLGVYFSVNCDLVVTPTDAIVQTISEVFKKDYSLIKNLFDCSMIVVSLSLCLVFQKPIYGIGLGTVVSAILLGRIISLHQHIFDNKMKQFKRS